MHWWRRKIKTGLCQFDRVPQQAVFLLSLACAVEAFVDGTERIADNRA